MQRNRSQWLSIAKFLEADPLIVLGIPGGWDVTQKPEPPPEGKRSAPGGGSAACPLEKRVVE